MDFVSNNVQFYQVHTVASEVGLCQYCSEFNVQIVNTPKCTSLEAIVSPALKVIISCLVRGVEGGPRGVGGEERKEVRHPSWVTTLPWITCSIILALALYCRPCRLAYLYAQHDSFRLYFYAQRHFNGLQTIMNRAINVITIPQSFYPCCNYCVHAQVFCVINYYAFSH